jgi:hypothetical protein
MKIGVIGGGSAGAVALLTILDKILFDGMFHVELYCIHDPNKPPINVGESASSFLLQVIHSSLNFCVIRDLEDLKGTLKFGTNYNWEEVNGSKFFANTGAPGLHIDSTIFSTYVIKKINENYDNFYEVHDNVKSISQDNTEVTVYGANYTYKFDYVIDCTGFASKEDLDSGKNVLPEFESVNSVILYPEQKKYDEMYTTLIAHKNGYMFGIPLTYRKTWGYLYNNKFTTKEEALNDFAKIKGIDTSSLRSFSWQPSYRLSPLDGRVLTMGNKLFFFEPFGAFQMHYYIGVMKATLSEIFNEVTGKQLEAIVKENHIKNIEQIQDVLAINYCGENKCNSKFWNYATKASRDRLKKSKSFQEWILSKPKHKFNKYWSFEPLLLNELIKGYKIDLNSLKNII